MLNPDWAASSLLHIVVETGSVCIFPVLPSDDVVVNDGRYFPVSAEERDSVNTSTTTFSPNERELKRCFVSSTVGSDLSLQLLFEEVWGPCVAFNSIQLRCWYSDFDRVLITTPPGLVCVKPGVLFSLHARLCATVLVWQCGCESWGRRLCFIAFSGQTISTSSNQFSWPSHPQSQELSYWLASSKPYLYRN